jgi:Response regulator receiver domain
MATARRYDAIIMDCHMPVMDGYTAARTIHAAEGRGRHTPIIALTAAALPEDRARCAAATMDDYLTKPITAGKVDAHLRRWIGPSGGAATGCHDAAAGGSAQSLHDAISGRLGQFLGDDGLADQMLGARILRSVLDSLPGKLADLAQSLQQRDVPRLASTAHALKGTFSPPSQAAAPTSGSPPLTASSPRAADTCPSIPSLAAGRQSASCSQPHGNQPQRRIPRCPPRSATAAATTGQSSWPTTTRQCSR